MADEAHVYVYLQRTADGRIAIGGRGVPYRYGSRTDGEGETAARTVTRAARRSSRAMFPPAARGRARARVVGGARAWRATGACRWGPTAGSGLAWAGGYVGEGVAASNLAGRTLRDLLLGEDSPLDEAAVGGAQAPRRWEPEPLRWAGIRGAYALYRLADRRGAAAAGDPRGWRRRSTCLRARLTRVRRVRQ